MARRFTGVILPGIACFFAFWEEIIFKFDIKKPNIDQKRSIKLQILLPVEFHRNINLRIRRRTFQMSPTAKNTRWLARRIYVWMTKIKPYCVFFCRTFFAACFSFFFRKDQTKTRKIVTHQNILRKETGAQLDSLAAFVNLISTIKQRNSFDINENKGIRKLVSFELRKKIPGFVLGLCLTWQLVSLFFKFTNNHNITFFSRI